MNSEFLSTELLCIRPDRQKSLNGKKIDLKRFSPDEIQECLAGRNFMASSRVNSLLITHAGMQI